MTDSTSTKKSSALLIAAAWIVVIIPTAWGLDYTVKNALKIFLTSTTPSTTPAK